MSGQCRGKRLFEGRLFAPRLFGPAPAADGVPGGSFVRRDTRRERPNDDDEILLLIASVVASGLLQ